MPRRPAFIQFFSGSGKSALIKRHCEHRFVSRYVMTIGIDYGVIKSKFKEFGFHRYFYQFLFPGAPWYKFKTASKLISGNDKSCFLVQIAGSISFSICIIVRIFSFWNPK